ncbi:MAG: DUF4430 domain-containing protein [Clostridiales bacterium]|nr:DUF4430 domain-containing protein [Clostridiales bacterium]
MWFKKNKWKIIIPLLIAAVLSCAFFADRAREIRRSSNDAVVLETSETPESTFSKAPEKSPEASPNAVETPSAAKTGEAKASPAAPASPAVSSQGGNSQTVKEKEKTELSCTISVSCSVLLDKLDLLPEEKRGLVPESGWILGPVKVTFSDGESVFDVLKRTLAEKKIHMEFTDTPAYKSAYIEGIGNLYEFDAGALSGWMYRVNGIFPNYGCSRYTLKNGDVIEWLYTCDLGEDIGGKNNYEG